MKALTLPMPEKLLEAIERYWACAYAEGVEQRTHDTEDGEAQRTLHEIYEGVKDYARAALSSHQAATDKESLTVGDFNLSVTDAEGREWRLMPVAADDAMCAADWDVSMSDAHSDGGVSAAAWRAMQAVAPKFEGALGDGGRAATSEIVSGALFDLMGMLTSQDEVCTFSSRHDAHPAVEQLRKFAEKRGLSLEPCDVSGWSKKLGGLGGEKGEAVASNSDPRLSDAIVPPPQFDSFFKMPAKGDYVLATKWFDGDPGDNWGVGYFDREEHGRFFVVDSAGKQIRMGGFRRVGHIDDKLGRWLLETAADILERSPPGSVNLWTMTAAYRERLSEEFESGGNRSGG